MTQQNDLGRINAAANELNAEAADVFAYQSVDNGDTTDQDSSLRAETPLT